MADLKVYGAPWCPDCKRTKKFLAEHRVPYDFTNIDEDRPASPRWSGRSHPRFTVHTGTEIVSIAGEGGHVTEVVAKDGTTGEELRWHPRAAFVFIGLDPSTAFLRGVLDLDDRGFVRTDDTFATSIPGVFAAGDARRGATKQLGAAVGDGIAALIAIRSYLQRRSDVRLIDIDA